MPRLSRAQELARQQIAHLASSGLLARQLGERLLAAIQVAVSFDGAQLCGVDPTTLLFNRLLAVSSGMHSHTHWYLRHLYLNEPVADFTHPNLMRAGLTAVVLHDRPRTVFQPNKCWRVKNLNIRQISQYRQLYCNLAYPMLN